MFIYTDTLLPHPQESILGILLKDFLLIQFYLYIFILWRERREKGGREQDRSRESNREGGKKGGRKGKRSTEHMWWAEYTCWSLFTLCIM